MTLVKICGITNFEDAELSVRCGADALGFNFYPKSPRFVTPEAVGAIVDRLKTVVVKVGVFVDEPIESILETARIAKLDAIQLHGAESSEFASEIKARTGLVVIKAFRVSPDFRPEVVLKYDVDAILLDACNPHEHGGTGAIFDWEIARRVKRLVPALYLAGGLSGENVDSAIRKVQPFAVDSCSLLESEKGRKDREKLLRFVSVIKKGAGTP
ncbi:MAG: phosphoribosylanthranilate isomerase [Acidobacteria bacterium]|nr:phosphoribosylanthranilate isomerase [Acidobacteriota bacterium]